MRKLHLNMAQNPKIVSWRFWGAVLLFLLLSVVFVYSGTRRLQTISTLKKDELKKIAEVKKRVAEIDRLTPVLRTELNSMRKRWNPRVSLANSLINKKSFSFIQGLEKLEEKLPGGVYFTRIELSIASKRLIRAGMVAVTFEKLIESYRQLADLNLNVSGESRRGDGSYQVSLSLNY